MKELEYPFDPKIIITRRKRLLRELLASKDTWLDKRVAVLGGATTADITKTLELFLLNHGIRAEFYESAYGQYWQEAVFPNPTLLNYRPEIIFIATSIHNIEQFPEIGETPEQVDLRLNTELSRFMAMWEKLSETYDCPIIQNNFEYPNWRLLGNLDATDIHGRVNYITRLNLEFAEYARTHRSFFINDINWQSADFGLQQWCDPQAWYLHRYALSLNAIPMLAHNVANIIKSIFGLNKKAIATDLDNTIWGGVVGDEGMKGLQLGEDHPIGRTFQDFQRYLKAQQKLGVTLNVISKNDEANALAGLTHPDSILNRDDFTRFAANWEPKSQNLAEMASSLNLLPGAFVFVDDNPAEREIVRQQVPEVSVPDIGTHPENYIQVLDRSGFFESTLISAEDASRVEMYRADTERETSQANFEDYDSYLSSLKMRAEIAPFDALHSARISQLINKTNQFNLTTERFTEDEIIRLSESDDIVTLYGRLTDKFGDNGIVAVMAGKINNSICTIVLCLMSCRVLKRGMEDAMMDQFVQQCIDRGVNQIIGVYAPTIKNSMVSRFYDAHGFELVETTDDGTKTYRLDLGRSQGARTSHLIEIGD